MNRHRRCRLIFGLVALVALGVAVVPARAQDVHCPASAGWTRLVSPDAPLDIRGQRVAGTLSVAASRERAPRLYVGGVGGLHRSDDCGMRWDTVPTPWRISPAVRSVATDRKGTILIGRDIDGIIVSTDHGGTWVEARGPSPRSRRISVSPAADGVVYAMFHQANSRGVQGVARSVDGGFTWELRTGRFSFAPIAADALSTEVAYLGGRGTVLRSADGGTTFAALDSSSVALQPDETVTALAMSADATRLWLGTRKGNLLRGADRGETWEQVQSTAYAGYLVDLSPSPLDSGVVFAVSNTGALWAYREPEGGELPLERPCWFDAILGFGRIWRTQALPRGDAGCPLEPEQSVAIYQMPANELTRYRVDYTRDYWLYLYTDGSWSTFDKATHPLPATGVTAIFGSIQRFEAATMVWLPKPDGSRAIFVLQDGLPEGVWEEFPDPGDSSENGMGGAGGVS